MTRPKLVAFDLDDTLIGSDGKIAPANFCALEQLSAAGVTAAAVTGRTFTKCPQNCGLTRWCPMRCTAMALRR